MTNNNTSAIARALMSMQSSVLEGPSKDTSEKEVLVYWDKGSTAERLVDVAPILMNAVCNMLSDKFGYVPTYIGVSRANFDVPVGCGKPFKLTLMSSKPEVAEMRMIREKYRDSFESFNSGLYGVNLCWHDPVYDRTCVFYPMGFLSKEKEMDNLGFIKEIGHLTSNIDAVVRGQKQTRNNIMYY